MRNSRPFGRESYSFQRSLHQIWTSLFPLLMALLAMAPRPAFAEGRRLALVIGVSVYDNSHFTSLRKTLGDAKIIGDALKAAHFDVTTVTDPVSDALHSALDTFISGVQRGDVVLIFFAGHGVEVNGKNYLLPGDFEADQSKLTTMAISADELLRRTGARSPALKILILDACRNNPLKFGSPTGLADMQASSYGGPTYIALAASPGQTAKDGVFVSHLAPEIVRPGQSIGDVFIHVRAEVSKETNNTQTPTSTDQQSTAFFFIPAAAADPDAALATLDRVSSLGSTGDLGGSKAVETLIASGRSLAGTEVLRGLSLRSAILNKADLSQADLTGTDLREASLHSANLSGVQLHFGKLAGADLGDVNLDDSSLAFTDFSDARLTGGKLSGSRWFAVRAEHSDFSRADLEGASFFLADLRNANFEGANLKNTVFVGSLLEGATFTGAIFSNTDLTDATVSDNALHSDQLQQICRTPYLPSGDVHPGFVGVGVTIIKKIPSDRFSGGFEYERLIDERTVFSLNNPSNLPVCKHRPNSKNGSVALMQLESGLEYISTDWSAGYSSQFLNAGRREVAFRAIIDQRFDGLKDKLKPDRTLHVAVEQSKFTTPPFAVPDKLPPNLDTVVLLLLHYHADLQDGLNWAMIASLRASYEIDMRRQQTPAVWGFFFPEGTYPEQVSPGLVKAFHDWTVTRAQRLPKTVAIYIQPRRKVDNGLPTLDLFAGRGFSDAYLNLSAINIDQKNLISFPVTLPALKTQQGNNTLTLSHFAIILSQPINSYDWPLSTEQDHRVTDLRPGNPWWTPGGEVKLLIEGVRIEYKQNLFLLEVQPVEFQMVNNMQPIFTLHAPAEK